MSVNPFTPGVTATLAVTTASANVALPVGISDQVMVTVPPDGALTFVEFGDDDTVEAAAATSTPVLPSAAYVFTVAPGTTHVAAIVPSGTSTIYATRGEGD